MTLPAFLLWKLLLALLLMLPGLLGATAAAAGAAAALGLWVAQGGDSPEGCTPGIPVAAVACAAEL